MKKRTRTRQTLRGYDRLSRGLHWLSALAIFAAIGLGLGMVRLPAGTEDEVQRVFRTYSLHKTIGLTILGLALLRIGWTTGNKRPGPLHPDRRAETFLAQTVHRLLLGAMLVLPLSGWLRHATAPGFAPILWPFGQTLPMVRADEHLSLICRQVHEYAGWLLFACLVLHISGTARHTILKPDGTLARMLTGNGPPVAPARPARIAGLLSLALWLAVIGLGILTAPAPQPDPVDLFDAAPTPPGG